MLQRGNNRTLNIKNCFIVIYANQELKLIDYQLVMFL